jgi:PleD family two-component response regulator
VVAEWATLLDSYFLGLCARTNFCTDVRRTRRLHECADVATQIMNFLIVDDYSANRRLLRASLEAEGHAVVEATNGIEALEKLAGESIDAVISDVLMPGMDGFRFCHEVRKSSSLN